MTAFAKPGFDSKAAENKIRKQIIAMYEDDEQFKLMVAENGPQAGKDFIEKRIQTGLKQKDSHMEEN